MNQLNPARDAYMRAARECDALRIFSGRNVVSRYEWEKYVSGETTDRLLRQEAITMSAAVVYVTLSGLELLFPAGTRPTARQ
jgi:hypothetical protein